MKKLFAGIMVFVMLISCCPLSSYAGGAVTVVKSGSVVSSYDITGNVSEAIIKAFDYCEKNASSSNRLTISVPNGNYSLDHSLTAANYTTLDLNGSSFTLASSDMTNMISTKSGSGYDGCDGFKLCNGTLSFTNSKGGDNCLIRVGHAKNITFDGLKIKSSFKSHLLEVAGSKNVVIENCEFDGINIADCRAYAVALQIDILNEEHFPGYAPYDGTSNDGITVRNCKFDNVPCGVGTHSLFAGFYQRNIFIENNTFNNITSEAVSCMSFIKTKITGNTITNCGAGINYNMMKTDYSTDKTNVSGDGKINTDCASEISYNNISVIKTAQYPTASPIYIFGNDVTNKNVDFKKGNYLVGNINVNNNTIQTAGYGLRLSDVKNSKIEYNTIETSSSSYPAISLYEASTNNSVTGNTLNGGKSGVATYTSSNDNSIAFNTVNNALVQGIYLNDDTAGNSVSYNTVNNAGQQGIYVRSSTCGVINGNGVYNAGHNGIHIKGTKTVADISYNTVDASKYTGIFVENGVTLPSICGNTVTNSGKFGIKTMSNVGKIKDNTVASNAQYGLCLDKNVKASVYRNTYTGNKSGAAVSMGSKNVKFSNVGVVKLSSVKKVKKTIEIKWKKASGASKYEVYRATSKNGKYTKIATVSAVKYVDKKAKKGKKNFYKIKPIKVANKSTVYGNFSAVKNVKF